MTPEQMWILKECARDPVNVAMCRMAPVSDAIRAAIARLDAAERVMVPLRMVRDNVTMAHYDPVMACFEALAAYDAGSGAGREGKP